MTPSLVKRGEMRRRLRTLRRRREAMLLDLGALVLEMHRHGRFLPDSLQRRAAEAVGTDAELRSLSRTLDAGDGTPDLVAAGIAGNCERCGALFSTGAGFCSQCGNELKSAALPHKAALGVDPELKGDAPVARRPVPTVGSAPAVAPAPAPAPTAAVAPIAQAEAANGSSEQTQVLDAPPETDAPQEPDGADTEADADPQEQPADTNDDADASPPKPPPGARRARATRVRQRLDEPARTSAPLPTGLLAGIAAGIVVIVLGIVVLSAGGGGDDEEPERATQTPGQREPEPPPPDEAPAPPEEPAPDLAALEPVAEVAAEDYDPSGDDEEHAAEAPLAVDGDAATAWQTEEYRTGALQKDGVGLTLTPAQAVSARGLDLQTTTPGFDVTIYGAESTLPSSIGSGWTEIASEESLPRRERIDLDTAGTDFAHYLVWITTVPADDGKVEISEARLLR